MSELTTISATKRERSGKGATRAVRRAGLVPAVIYGSKKSPESINMESREVTRIVHQPGIFSRLLEIDVKGSKSTVLTRDIQFHPVTDVIMHMDFLRVSQSAQVTVSVPVEFINEDKCPGIRVGGVLNVVRHEIELECPATAIPDTLTFDLEGVAIGDSIHISAIELPENVVPTITDRDFTVATLASPGGGVKNEDEEEDGEAAEGETGEESQED